MTIALRLIHMSQVYTKATVPDYGPVLPSPSTFEDPAELRHFILVKREPRKLDSYD